MTNISDFDPATGRTTTTLVQCHERGSHAYYCHKMGWPDCFECEEPEPELPRDVAAFTIAVIQAWVDAHDHLADEVRAAELARGPDARSTLITWLDGFIAARDEEGES